METRLVRFIYRTPSRKKGTVMDSMAPIYLVWNSIVGLKIHLSERTHYPRFTRRVPCEPRGSAWKRRGYRSNGRAVCIVTMKTV